MVIVRRLVAIVLQLLLFQATASGSGMTCAPTNGNAATAARQSMHTMHDARHAVRHGADADHAPAHTHDGAHDMAHDMAHCIAATGCAALPLPSTALDISAGTIVRTRAEEAPASLHAVVRAAPEPPPPRG